MANNKSDKKKVSDFDSENESKFGITDGIKKMMSLGIGAAFMTEEGIRNYLADSKLPKELLAKLVEGAHKSKQELLDRVGDELVSIVKKIDLVQEAARFVENHKFRIVAEIEVQKKDTPKAETEIKSEAKSTK